MKNAYEIKELLDNGGSICIYDTETTGHKKPESRILSFSAIIVRKVDGHLQEEKRMDILMDPECDIPDFITDINHISNEDVVGCPTEKEMCQQIIDFLESADVITGYNSHNFDNWFIDQMSRRVRGRGWEPPKDDFDVFVFVKDKIKKSPKVPNQKLGTIAEHLKVTEGLEFHNSIDDVIATSRVLEKVLNMYSDEDAKNQTAVIPISATVWQKGSLSRLYINNNKNHSVYFDIIGREWSFTSPEDEQMIEKLLGAYNLEVLIKNGRTMF